jgi:hypothetical protein
MRKSEMLKAKIVEQKPVDPLEKKTEDLLKQVDEVIATPPVTVKLYFKDFFKTYQIDKNGQPQPVVLKEKLFFPPQGAPASMIVRSKEMAAAVPPEARPFVLDKDGNPLPEWIQIRNMFDRPHKKVAIVGFADTKDQAPFDDPSFEIWGLNDLHGSLKRYDRWFDIHPRDNIELDTKLMRNAGQTPPENIGLSGLKKLNVPIYMQDRYEDVPFSVKFPLKEITESFQFGKYMTNSISYMTALAIYEGYEEIHIYGVDMAVGTEYVNQRPSCEYWVGVAAGRGIKLFIPNASDLCKTRFMYGFEEAIQNEYNEKLDNMAKNMSERHRQICQQEQQAHDARMQFEGAMGCRAEIQKIWANLHDKL